MPLKSTLTFLLLALGTQLLWAQATTLALATPTETLPAAAPAPVPAAEVVSLDMTFYTESLVTLEVRDALGQVLFASQVIYPAGERAVKVSLGEVADGVYFVRAATDLEEQTQMVVIDRAPR